MNRAERRRAKHEAEKQQATFTYTLAEIQKIQQEAEIRGCERAFLYMLNFSIITLRDWQEWGKKRLETFADKILEQYCCFDSDNVTLHDIRKAIFDEVGLDFVGRGMDELIKKK